MKIRYRFVTDNVLSLIVRLIVAWAIIVWLIVVLLK